MLTIISTTQFVVAQSPVGFIDTETSLMLGTTALRLNRDSFITDKYNAPIASEIIGELLLSVFASTL